MTRNRDRQGTLLVHGRKRKFWLVQWPEGEKRLSKTLGRCDEMTRSQAQRAKRQWMEQINRHREVAGESVTLESFDREHYWDQEREAYGDELRSKRPSTKADVKCCMRKTLLPYFGAKKLDRIRTGEIQKFLVSLIGPKEEGKIKRKTALKYKQYLSSIFSAAIRLEAGITHNPVPPVRLPAEEPEVSRTHINPEQAVAIEDALKDPRHKMVWKLKLWMGIRRGEVRGLRWSACYWEHDTILVRESVWGGHSNLPKSRKGYRKVRFTPSQMAELREYKDKHTPEAGPADWVFPGKRNRPLDMRWLMSKYVKPIADGLGIKGVRWNALRHLNNSIMLNEGVDVKVRQDRLGHVTDRVNMIYSHPDDASQVAASKAIERRLEAAKKKLREAGSEAGSPALTVTHAVTQNSAVSVSA